MNRITLSNDGKTLVSCQPDRSGNIEVPPGVERIGAKAFYRCSNLCAISLPDSLKVIGNSAFAYCNNLQSIVIPDGVYKIEDYAFRDCSALTTINIPDCVSEFGLNPFVGCCNLAQPLYNKTFFVHLPHNYYGVYTIPFGIETVHNDSFAGCKELISVVIPESVTAIQQFAFSRCGLASIQIPESVKLIGKAAFFHCDSMHSVEILGRDVMVECDAFCECSNLSSVRFVDNVVCIGEGAFRDCINLKTFNLPNGLKSITIGLFERCTNLSSIKISDGVVDINMNAFDRCNLKTIDIPDSVKCIVNSVYAGRDLVGMHIRHINPNAIEIKNPQCMCVEVFENCTLFVPKGTEQAYRNHSFFGHFRNIDEE